MTVIEAKVKRWGNSLGIIIPSEAAEENNLKENKNIKVIILKDSREAFKKTFGIAKHIKKTGQQFKDDARKELY